MVEPTPPAPYAVYFNEQLETAAAALVQGEQLQVMEELLPADMLRQVAGFNNPRPRPPRLPTPAELRAVSSSVWDDVVAELFGDALRSAARGGQLHTVFKGAEFLPRAIQLLPKGQVYWGQFFLADVVRICVPFSTFTGNCGGFVGQFTFSLHVLEEFFPHCLVARSKSHTNPGQIRVYMNFHRPGILRYTAPPC